MQREDITPLFLFVNASILRLSGFTPASDSNSSPEWIFFFSNKHLCLRSGHSSKIFLEPPSEPYNAPCCLPWQQWDHHVSCMHLCRCKQGSQSLFQLSAGWFGPHCQSCIRHQSITWIEYCDVIWILDLTTIGEILIWGQFTEKRFTCDTTLTSAPVSANAIDMLF